MSNNSTVREACMPGNHEAHVQCSAAVNIAQASTKPTTMVKSTKLVLCRAVRASKSLSAKSFGCSCDVQRRSGASNPGDLHREKAAPVFRSCFAFLKVAAFMPGCDVQGFQVRSSKSARRWPPDWQVDTLNFFPIVWVVANNCCTFTMGNPQVTLAVNGHAIQHNALLFGGDHLAQPSNSIHTRS